MTFMLGHVTFRQEDRRLVSCLLFWQDVTDYGKEEDRSADRLLRLCHAWNIYNLYFPDGSNYPIGRPHCLHTCMCKQSDVTGQYCYQHKDDLYYIVDYFGCFDQRYSESVWNFLCYLWFKDKLTEVVIFQFKMYVVYVPEYYLPPPHPFQSSPHSACFLGEGPRKQTKWGEWGGMKLGLAFLLNFVEEASTVFRRNAKLYQI